jgi:hypothetical protein
MSLVGEDHTEVRSTRIQGWLIALPRVGTTCLLMLNYHACMWNFGIQRWRRRQRQSLQDENSDRWSNCIYLILSQHEFDPRCSISELRTAGYLTRATYRTW